MPGVLSYFGIGHSAAPADVNQPAKKTPIRALPAQWYTSKEMYELERRAIFCRKWLFITHQNRIPEPGDFLRYTVAGYQFVIARDRVGNVNAFHNVCRHRAYPVIEKECGQAKIFQCRYHGWTYGVDGKLAKAPGYNILSDFDKEQNGLFQIAVRIDDKGFIWVNMDRSKNGKPEIEWETDFDTVDKQERFEQFDFNDYVLDHTYELQGAYNWKNAADNFNECYHCKTTHPDVPNFLTIDSADCETKAGHIQHDHASTPEQREKGFNVNSTYYFPNVSMSISPHFMMIQKILPTGPIDSTMHYEVYRNKNSSEEDFKTIADTYARVMGEDKVLCDRAQRNLNAGVYTNGELHPKHEKGPLFFQGGVRDAVTEHFKREKAAGHEIWPARQQLPETATMSQDDLEICKGLGIGCGTQREGLVW